MQRLLCSAVICVLAMVPEPSQAEKPSSTLQWKRFSNEIFTQAAKEKKLILLDVEAVWCHWCHVMDEVTYSREDVQSYLKKHYIIVRVDQDSRPDIAARYQDYGWPATVILDSKGTDIFKKAGFLEPQEFMDMVKEAVANPVPHDDDSSQSSSRGEPSSGDGVIPPDISRTIEEKHRGVLDVEGGGWRRSHRFLIPDSMEYSILRGGRGEEPFAGYIKKTLTANLKLIDPVWGGAYQYSTHSDWDHPHFEKLVATQATNLHSYALAFGFSKDAAYLDAGQRVYRYLKLFLTSPDGAFYASQDADVVRGQHSDDYFKKDDAERRKQGIPVVDTHRYSSENGYLITALVALYGVAGNDEILADAKRAAHWILENRSLPAGGFRHDEKDEGGPFLRDSMFMGRALLSLYMATGDRSWLDQCVKTADFMRVAFVEKDRAGFVTHSSAAVDILKPVRLLEDNVAVARFYNLLAHYTGKEEYRGDALTAMKWLSTKEVAGGGSIETGLLIANAEVGGPPLHITVVGQKDDVAARKLFLAGLSYPTTYKRLEWWDKREGPMPNPDVKYPSFDKAVAFICTAKRCSPPIETADELLSDLAMTQAKQAMPPILASRDVSSK